MLGDAPIAGLVLTGGRSLRMQRDKAALPFAGETQLARAMRLLGQHAARVFVSVRADQRDDPERRRYEQIVDALEDVGPAAGILAAQAALPDHAWLVVAVDLPLLDSATLEHLRTNRDPTTVATAYRSVEDGLPEPLCAIWEPASHLPLSAFVQGGRSCPRKFLITHAAKLVDLPSPDALRNVNTPADYARTVQGGLGAREP